MFSMYTLKCVLLPFIAWGVSGGCKFCVNYFYYGKNARFYMGYGGWPSTHTAIISAPVFFTGLEYGINTPIFSMGISVVLIVMIDAHGLRQMIGKQAGAINKLSIINNKFDVHLRERIGHTWGQIFSGLIVGFITGAMIYLL